MAYTRGRCSNVDYCTLAVAKRDIEVRLGEDFICPECARQLRPPPTREASGGLNLAVAAAGLALVLIGGGIYAGYRLSGASAPRPALALAAPSPEAATLIAARPATPVQTAAAAGPASPVPVRAEQTVLLRLASSGVVGGAFAQRLAASYLTYLGDTGISVQPGKTGSQVLVIGQRLSRPEAIAIVTPPDADGGDAAGFGAIGRNEADASIAARRALPAEMAAMHDAGEHQIGFEGEAIVVNPHNPVAQISVAQVRGVLAGTITGWAPLGGPDRAIHVLREIGGGSLADLLPGTVEAVPAEHRLRNPAAAVMDDPDALAIVPLAAAGLAKQVAIAAIGAPPALPTPSNIAGEAYPLARSIYVYAQAGTANPFAQRFAQYAASPDGQAVVTQAGLVPLHVAAAAPAAPLTPKDRYKELVVGSKRLAADLHFEPNSNKLDLHSAREVDRIWNFMMSDHTPSDHIVLIGFADNQGSQDANLAISQQRAQAVADVFARRGLPPGKIVPFGSDLPVADNGNEDGREKNRRVEVFLRP